MHIFRGINCKKFKFENNQAINDGGAIYLLGNGATILFFNIEYFSNALALIIFIIEL